MRNQPDHRGGRRVHNHNRNFKNDRNRNRDFDRPRRNDNDQHNRPFKKRHIKRDQEGNNRNRRNNDRRVKKGG